MKKLWQGGAVLVLALLLACGMVLLAGTRQPVLGGSENGAGSAGAPHYTVVETQAHNLLVTDNATSKLYFYTIDKDAPIGSPLKLRASLDLADVGKPMINITKHEVEKENK